MKNTASLWLLILMLIASGCGSDNNPVSPPDSGNLVINSISPTSASAGESVTISGSGFSITSSDNNVTFGGGAQADVTAASASELTVTVPQGAADGPIKVTVGSESTSSAAFTVKAEVPDIYNNLPGNKTLIAKDETWANDTTIVGPHFVLPGATLTVNAGVTVKFKYHNNNADDVGTIITLPGTYDNFSDGFHPSGRLVAQGTADNPIIFTSAGHGDGNAPQVGDWGGIILAGNASNNWPGGQGEIEGLSSGVQYGVDTNNHQFNDDDDSGVLSYVQLDYTGYSIADGSELQALTPYSVGSKTKLDHISIYQSLDDGIEPFGGTFDLKYLVVVGAQDDSFDGDAGWQGHGQFWLAVQTTPSNRGFENDGCATGDPTNCSGGNGNSQFHVYNATVWGNDQTNGEIPMSGMMLREGLQGSYGNIIIANFGSKNTTAPIYVEDDATRTFIGNQLTLGGMISYRNDNNDYTGLGYVAADLDVLQVNSNETLFTDSSNHDFSLVAGSAGTTHHIAVPNDSFYTQTDFSGAVGVKGSANDWTTGATWIKWSD